MVATSLWATAATQEQPRASPWTVVERDGPSTLSLREFDEDGIIQFRLTYRSNIAVRHFVDVLRNWRRHPEFFPHVVQRRCFQVGDQLYSYSRIDPPLISPRDYVLQLKETSGRDGAFLSEFRTVNDVGPAPFAGVIRMPMMQGSWSLAPDRGGGTLITYVLAADPGGSTPRWIGNRTTRRALTSTVDALVARVEKLTTTSLAQVL